MVQKHACLQRVRIVSAYDQAWYYSFAKESSTSSSFITAEKKRCKVYMIGCRKVPTKPLTSIKRTVHAEGVVDSPKAVVD